VARQRPPLIGTEIPSEAIIFDPLAFDTMLRSQGVQMDHYIAIRCPIGMTDLDDNRRPHGDHSNCSNGFLYKRAGTVTAILTSNSKQSNFQDVGIMDQSTFQMSVPRDYDDPEDKLITIAPFDRFFLREENVVVVYWQLFLPHQSGQDRLNFPVVEVIRLVDSLGREYVPCDDFDIVGGQLQWKGTNRPGIDPETGRGRIYSIRYTYRPYVYVGPMLHDLRVTSAVDQQTGEQKIIRMPQSATVHREYVFLNARHDPEALDSGECRRDPQDKARQAYGPADGSFGPR